MEPRVILDSKKFALTLNRLCYQLIENHGNFSNSVIIGVQPRGIHLADRVVKLLSEINNQSILYAKLDISLYRDDFKNKQLNIQDTTINFSIEGKNIVLIDDVLFTGRTIRSAMDALLDFGRPGKVELLVLIDRRFTRQFPIQADYIGKTIDSIYSEQVKVDWKETEGKDAVWIMKEQKDEPVKMKLT